MVFNLFLLDLSMVHWILNLIHEQKVALWLKLHVFAGIGGIFG